MLFSFLTAPYRSPQESDHSLLVAINYQASQARKSDHSLLVAINYQASQAQESGHSLLVAINYQASQAQESDQCLLVRTLCQAPPIKWTQLGSRRKSRRLDTRNASRQPQQGEASVQAKTCNRRAACRQISPRAKCSLPPQCQGLCVVFFFNSLVDFTYLRRPTSR